MNKSQLVDAVVRHSGLTKKDASKAVDAVLVSLSEALGKREEISFVGFGRFKISHRAERDGRNPKTGEKIKISARNVVRFTPSSELHKVVNQ